MLVVLVRGRPRRVGAIPRTCSRARRAAARSCSLSICSRASIEKEAAPGMVVPVLLAAGPGSRGGRSGEGDSS